MNLDDAQQILVHLGLDALGLASPMLAVRWTGTGDLTTPAEGAAGTLSLTSTKTWMAPAAGFLAVAGGADRILMPQGTPAPADAAVLRLHPHVYLRLARLYASVIEKLTDKTHRPQRPVPYFFVFTARGAGENPESGEFRAGESLGLTGTLTIHDAHGLAIDPVAVAAAFDAFLDKFDVLEAKTLLSTTSTASDKRQIHAIGKLGAEETRIHLIDPHGKPQDGTNLEKLTALDAAAGLFKLDSAGATITRKSGAPDGLRIGPATTGTLDTSFAVPKPTPTLHRDFLRAFKVDLKPFLIGERPADDAAADVEPLPEIRHDESVTFSMNGNAVLGVANEILKGSPDAALIVSPALQGSFAIPEDGTDAKAQWPHFPSGLDQTTDPVPGSLRDKLEPSAHFLDGTPEEEADVVLTLKGLTKGQAVRVYPRAFLPDAREGRRDGAGAAVGSTGEVVLVLRDPLGLVKRGEPTTLPPEPVLHVDLVVVNSADKARVFGNLVTGIGAKAPLTPAPPTETNPFGSGDDRGIASAGILGLPAQPLPSGGVGSLEDLWKLVRALGSEGSPRDAPRLPTMARRSAVVASRTVSGSTGTWHSQVSGIHLVPASRHAKPRLGNPGNPGGKEFHTVAAETKGGLLAYDLARAAQRRTRDIATRLTELDKSRWTPPAAATGGTVSGAVLHTVAPVAETPELSVFKTQIRQLPATWEEFVDKVKEKVPALEDAVKNLRDSAEGKRLYAETKRELSASVHGRRDALWALERAVKSARASIYLEGPAFTDTDYDATPANTAKDLVSLLEDRLKKAPGLRVVLCLSKEMDYAPGYETFTAREIDKRLKAVARLQAAAPGRVVAFHPIGFPGRALRLMTSVVVVDDLWAMVGTSAFRRRGLTFDEGLDLVLFDRKLEEGRGVAIASLRRQLMAGHLGVAAPAAGEIPHPSWVALADGYQAFAVFKELLDQEGAGLIEKLWDGKVPGVPSIPESDFPLDAVADPDGREVVEDTAALLLAALHPVLGPILPA